MPRTTSRIGVDLTANSRRGAHESTVHGTLVPGQGWERFGRYNAVRFRREDGAETLLKTHAGELTPGSTEDFLDYLRTCDGAPPQAPFTLELDATYRCTSPGCGGACFSAEYRRLRPSAEMSSITITTAIREFAKEGGRVVRFDGGGEPLLHEGIRSGRHVVEAAELGLRTTVLTAGDQLPYSDWRSIVDAGCYLRISLNAASAATRRRVHGRRSDVALLWSTLEQICQYSSRHSGPPVGTTFLLTATNYGEVEQAARRAREIGVSHFSARRVLGPPALRPHLPESAVRELDDLLAATQMLGTEDFVVMVPSRTLAEPDLSPRDGDFAARECWQSTFKTVLEPADSPDQVRIQLCGRYRGGGVGQLTTRPALAANVDPSRWVGTWRSSFIDHQSSRPALIQECISCIDRGFIATADALVDFTEMGRHPVQADHLWLTAAEVEHRKYPPKQVTLDPQGSA